MDKKELKPLGPGQRSHKEEYRMRMALQKNYGPLMEAYARVEKELTMLRKKIHFLRNGIHIIHDKIAYDGYKENGGSEPLLDDIQADLQKILDRK